MPSAEEDHDHDLSGHSRRGCRHHHRRILWTLNAKTRRVQRQRHRVPKSKSPAAPVSTHIAPTRRTPRPSKGKSSTWSPPSPSSSTATSPQQPASSAAPSRGAAHLVINRLC